MTAANQQTASGPRAPISAPGGTATLAARPVARIGFGAMQLERPGAGRDTALAILRQAVRGGVNHIDTAHFYGEANGLIRDALAPYPGDLVLATKVGADRDAGGKLIPAQRPHELRAQVDANLAALGVERVGVVNMRRVDAPPGIVAAGEQRVDLDDQLASYDKTLLIPGTSSAAHLVENLAAGDVTLPESAIATLDHLAPGVPRKESQP